MNDKKRKVCTICGLGFVPTGNNQRYCPECRTKMNKEGTVKEAFLKYRKARQPSECITYKAETPEDVPQQPETPENPAPPDGWEAWNEEQKNIDLPDGLAVIEKKPMTEKQIRKSNITQMAVVAAMAKDITMEDGVCGLHPYLVQREPFLQYKPGVQLQPWKFFQLFGEDTNYEYLEDMDGDKSLYTEVNGVVFHALINSLDEIIEGRLV